MEWIAEFRNCNDLQACRNESLVSEYATNIVKTTGSVPAAKRAISSMQFYVGLSWMPYNKSYLNPALAKGLKSLYVKAPKKVEPFSTTQVLAMLGYLVKGDDTNVTNLHLASLILICWFASVSFRDVHSLVYDSVTLHKSGDLLVHFPIRGSDQHLEKQTTVIKKGHFIGSQIYPVDLLRRYITGTFL